MIGLLCFVLAALASAFKSKIRLEAENAALRHQLIVLRRKLRGRVKLANSDRWFFIQLYRAGYPTEPLVSYQINRQLSGWNLPPLVIRAFGAHCQKQTWNVADTQAPVWRRSVSPSYLVITQHK
jgi:hypothetical protein